MIDVAAMRAAGFSGDEIARMIEAEQQERKAQRREQNRINQQNHRARQPKPADRQHVSADTLTDSLTKEVSKKEATNEESKKEEKKVRTSRLHEIPPDWRPNAGHAAMCETLHVPLGEVEAVFRDSCAATGKLYANHDFAFNTYIRNFNRYNGGGGNAQRNRAADRAHELAEQVRQREFEIGLGRPPKYERGG